MDSLQLPPVGDGIASRFNPHLRKNFRSRGITVTMGPEQTCGVAESLVLSALQHGRARPMVVCGPVARQPLYQSSRKVDFDINQVTRRIVSNCHSPRPPDAPLKRASPRYFGVTTLAGLGAFSDAFAHDLVVGLEGKKLQSLL